MVKNIGFIQGLRPYNRFKTKKGIKVWVKD